ncbi:MAG: GlxA family transcriptional regulator [Rhodospirillaceae bacterium]|nr:GlxA family transcriptional regulator [Rhodospirillaceae bacterium]
MTNTHRKSDTVRFAFVLIPRFNMMALTATLEPLRVANYLCGRALYDWVFVSPDGGRIIASNGIAVDTEPLPADSRKLDTIYVCGSWDSEHYEHREMFAWLRRHSRMGVRLGAMDIGVYILARAGLLAGYRAAVLWYCIRAFSEAYPETDAEERLFIADRNRITIAGGTAGVDGMLNDISQRLGAPLGREVSNHVLHYPVRTSDSAPRHGISGRRGSMHAGVGGGIHLVENHVEEPLPIPEIAARLNVNQRKLERLFHRHVDRSAIGYYRVLRLQHALVLLTNTELSIREISVACGYSSLSHFAKSFAAQYGKRPRDCRDAWPLGDPAPVWPGLSTSLNDLRPVVNRTQAG